LLLQKKTVTFNNTKETNMASPAYTPDGSIPANFDPNMGQGVSPVKNPIEDLYKMELGRAPDESGLTNWTNLYNTGMSLDDIRQQIGSSDEGQRYDINTMYREDLGRDADTGGLNSWLSALQGGMSLDDIRNQGIRGSQEFMNRQAQPTFNPYTPPEVSNPYNDPYNAPQVYNPYTPPEVYNPTKPYEPPKPYVDPYAGTPYEGTGGPSRPYREPPPPPQYIRPDRPDYPGEPPQYIRPDYPGEPPQYIRPDYLGEPPQVDPVMDFVQNIDQQLPQLQRAFQEQLQLLGDPAAAARAVLRSFR
jgi:hypothetical protein